MLRRFSFRYFSHTFAIYIWIRSRVKGGNREKESHSLRKKVCRWFFTRILRGGMKLLESAVLLLSFLALGKSFFVERRVGVFSFLRILISNLGRRGTAIIELTGQKQAADLSDFASERNSYHKIYFLTKQASFVIMVVPSNIPK
ncbi:hypothetical protein TNIN_492341 [Trichonephila inaurata madagascariensis]|uniref:Uncharacterized protein n=1 Tax=Trichonephila inaurata madagascariensis TaxID=2747483 RepID=A0A8X6YGC8_9ARAC|nr:hypothetical protein TNIN_492341 [Trichonephila inaurata madagascariensis]